MNFELSRDGKLYQVSYRTIQHGIARIVNCVMAIHSGVSHIDTFSSDGVLFLSEQSKKELYVKLLKDVIQKAKEREVLSPASAYQLSGQLRRML